MTLEFWAWLGAGLSLSTVLAWTWLTFFRGRFWATDQRLAALHTRASYPWPRIVAVIPARNEAHFIGQSLTSVINQSYPGHLSIYLVDDRSSDATAEVAGNAACAPGPGRSFQLVQGEPRPQGWAGKVWALHQGVHAAAPQSPDYFWFTDADIVHSPNVLTSLVAKAETDALDMVSVMATLHVSTFWDKLLVPAFVFFFGKLYPFRWVNNHRRSTAAAAGGCVLVRRDRLTEVGEFNFMKNAIIDDCALARLVQGPDKRGRLWLGLSRDVRSIRPYQGLSGIWGMVARTAYVQLRTSPVLLAATVLGMLWLYLWPVAALGLGLALAVSGAGDVASLVMLVSGSVAWAVMGGLYLPMVRWYGLGQCWALPLVLAGALYTLMTIDSAWRSWRGRGGGWKGRTY